MIGMPKTAKEASDLVRRAAEDYETALKAEERARENSYARAADLHHAESMAGQFLTRGNINSIIMDVRREND
jgi:hypothetical protein